MTITTNETSSVSNVTVICHGEQSCDSMEISISNFYDFNVYCLGIGSCNDAVFNLNVSNERVF